MAGRKIRTADEAEELLDRAAASGMDRAAWARCHGIDARSLNAWRLNLTRRAPQAPLRLVEVVPASVTTPPDLVVRCGPFAVEVPHGFDADTLQRVLSVVASC